MTEREKPQAAKPYAVPTPSPTIHASLSAAVASPGEGVVLLRRQEAIRLRIPKHTTGKSEWWGTPINAKMRDCDRLLKMFVFNASELDLIEKSIEAERTRWEVEMERRSRYARGSR